MTTFVFWPPALPDRYALVVSTFNTSHNIDLQRIRCRLPFSESVRILGRPLRKLVHAIYRDFFQKQTLPHPAHAINTDFFSCKN